MAVSRGAKGSLSLLRIHRTSYDLTKPLFIDGGMQGKAFDAVIPDCAWRSLDLSKMDEIDLVEPLRVDTANGWITVDRVVRGDLTLGLAECGSKEVSFLPNESKRDVAIDDRLTKQRTHI